MLNTPPISGHDLERLRAGDERTFVDLVGRHHDSMVRVARSFVPSYAVAQEVVQDTWLAVLRGMDGFEGRSSFQTWLYRILINRRGPPEYENIVTFRSATTSAVWIRLGLMWTVSGRCRRSIGATTWTTDFRPENCRRRSGPRSMSFQSSNEALWHSVTSKVCAAPRSVNYWKSPRRISGSCCTEVEAGCVKPSRPSSVSFNARVSSPPPFRVSAGRGACHELPRRCAVGTRPPSVRSPPAPLSALHRVHRPDANHHPTDREPHSGGPQPRGAGRVPFCVPSVEIRLPMMCRNEANLCTRARRDSNPQPSDP